jgi:hypothetical protein
MNLQSLVVVVLRLMSLNFLLQGAVQIAPLFFRFAMISQQSGQGEMSWILSLPWLVCLILGGCAVILWVFSVPIARFVTADLPADISLGALTLADCYSIAFMGVGLFCIIGHFAGVLIWTQSLIRMAANHQSYSWSEQVDWYQVTQTFVSVIFGIILFVNSRRWAIALARRHSEIVPPTGPNPDQSPGMP